MCTAISEYGKYHLFGRTLDLECSYGEMATITPREFPLEFLYERPMRKHLAMIGIAYVHHGIPLYYDAVNETGLAIAGLNFPGNAIYHKPRTNAHNVTSFELIPWLLGQCSTLTSVLELLKNTNITAESVSQDLPATPLHWLIADRNGAITVESTAEGLQIYPNPFGVLTNNPPFPYHITHISNFMHIGAEPPQNRLCPSIELAHYSRGMGGIGLPGDLSSSSRFVRAVFAKTHTLHGKSEQEEISRFFHIMGTVSQPLGCAMTETGQAISTVYTSCANTATATYYFSTYACRRIRTVQLRNARLDSDTLVTFPMDADEDILRLDE